ncbi:MAG: hypothetical protein ACK4GN_09655 [Runella sp.]
MRRLFSPKKIHIWLTAIVLTIGVSKVVSAQIINLQAADSLFLHGKYREAGMIYEKFLRQRTGVSIIALPIYYKLAFINEQQNHYARALYYLSIIYNRQPRQNILNKINEIAVNHALEGYELDDFSFVFLFFRQYSVYLTLFLLLIGLYAFGVIIYKQNRGEAIRKRHKWTVFIYFIALLALLNLPASYQIGIINKTYTHLREAPSSAAPVVKSIREGNKVAIIGQSDQWLRVWWQDQPFYVRRLDVWPIE